MASNTYTLVNPMIVGTMKTSVNAPSSSAAAIELYNRLSPFFASAQSNFIFTIQKVKNNKQLGGGTAGSYYSFKVKEVENNGEVVFTISNYSGNVKLGNLKNSISRVQDRVHNGIDLADSEKPKQQGGKHKKHDDEDDEDMDELLEELDEDDDKLFRKKNKTKYITELALPILVDPIQYYWYSPIVYEVPKIIVPSFIPTVVPRIIIDLGI